MIINLSKISFGFVICVYSMFCYLFIVVASGCLSNGILLLSICVHSQRIACTVSGIAKFSLLV